MATRILTIIYILFAAMISGAQTLSTKETKVVLVIGPKSEAVTHITLFNTFQKMDKDLILRKYPDAKFYIGLLKGTYELNNDTIDPSSDSTIIMYTEKQFFPGERFSTNEEIAPGDRFDLGKTKAKVVSNKKGELTLKIQ